MKSLLLLVSCFFLLCSVSEAKTWLPKSQPACNIEIYTAQPAYEFKLPFDFTFIPGLFIVFWVDDLSYVEIGGHIFLHTLAWEEFPADVNVGCAVDVLLDGVRMTGSVAGENIDKPRHYYYAPLDGVGEVGRGWHQVGVRGRSYSGIYPNRGRMVNTQLPEYSLMTVKVIPISQDE